RVFAVAIPRGIQKPAEFTAQDFLRKDIVFLFERYFQLLDQTDDTGLLVMDQTDKSLDRKFVRHVENYFNKTQTGRWRASRIIPSPLFVSSDMTYPVQVADVCIYCVNWAFRIPTRGMDAPVRQEITDQFAGYLGALQHRAVLQLDSGEKITAFSIAYVQDPYTARP
ncbi:MAG: DUF3800 domain-containing protein, partial [Candidatus Obscuribacterales bacterium]|nr:DUF3800 domain-containing protein [Candidatus Obscuribacterales bacterium]